jgi:hypothetical protein
LSQIGGRGHGSRGAARGGRNRLAIEEHGLGRQAKKNLSCLAGGRSLGWLLVRSVKLSALPTGALDGNQAGVRANVGPKHLGYRTDRRSELREPRIWTSGVV